MPTHKNTLQKIKLFAKRWQSYSCLLKMVNKTSIRRLIIITQSHPTTLNYSYSNSSYNISQKKKSMSAFLTFRFLVRERYLKKSQEVRPLVAIC